MKNWKSLIQLKYPPGKKFSSYHHNYFGGPRSKAALKSPFPCPEGYTQYKKVSLNTPIMVTCILYGLEILLEDTIFAFAGSIVNLTLLVALWRERNKFSTLSSLALANLASDVCFLASGVLFSYRYINNIPASTDKMIAEWLNFANNQVLASILFSHILIVGVQSILAAKFPLVFKRVSTRQMTLCAIVIAWILPSTTLVNYHPSNAILYVILLIGAFFTIGFSFSIHRMMKFERNQSNKARSMSNTESEKDDCPPSFLEPVCLFLSYAMPCVAFLDSIEKRDVLGAWQIDFSFLFVVKSIANPLTLFCLNWISLKTTKEEDIINKAEHNDVV